MIRSLARLLLVLLFHSVASAQALRLEVQVERLEEPILSRIAHPLSPRKYYYRISPILINDGGTPLSVLLGPPERVRLLSERTSYAFSILPKWSAGATSPELPPMRDLRNTKLAPGERATLAQIETRSSTSGLPKGKFYVRYYVDPWFAKNLNAWVGELTAEGHE
jgi:hypothetical protein